MSRLLQRPFRWAKGGRFVALLFGCASALGGAHLAGAQSPAAPRGAASCSGCHAPASLGSVVPPLAGQPSADIVTAMQEFRSGARDATVMDRIAKGFSDEETRAIAAWLSAQR